jgi:hypothetical protein
MRQCAGVRACTAAPCWALACAVLEPLNPSEETSAAAAIALKLSIRIRLGVSQPK